MTQYKNRQQQFLFLLQHCFCKHFFHSVNNKNFKLLKRIIKLLMMRAAKSLNNKKSIFNYEIIAKIAKIS